MRRFGRSEITIWASEKNSVMKKCKAAVSPHAPLFQGPLLPGAGAQSSLMGLGGAVLGGFGEVRWRGKCVSKNVLVGIGLHLSLEFWAKMCL